MEKNSDKTAIVLANGEFPKNNVLLEKLLRSKMIICCDGAVQNLLNFGIIPNFIVGDMDSISEESKIKFADILVPVQDTDTNDLTKAVKFCIKKGFKNVEIFGATGKREDHTLGNISLLADYMDELVSVKMFTDYGVFIPISQTTTLESFANQVVSIFSITPETLITTENLAYPVKNHNFRSWWEGTLNRSLGEQFSVAIDCGKIVIFQGFCDSTTRKIVA
ncbi:MAG: thiamine diphosphokinase [Bacteroidales bacterium]|nr:thiamine diphosphokinase [Bacteroidales bacterium]